MKSNIRFGVIGLGRIARTAHLPAIKKHAELVALCSRDKRKAEAWSREWGAEEKHGYTDFREMLKREDIDAVLIATPNALHKPQVVEAAEAGKHILLEKPAAINLKEIELMAKAVQANGVKCLVGHHRRFQPPFEATKRLVEEGLLGALFLVKSSMLIDIDFVPGLKSWREIPELSGGGVFMDMGSHMIDAVRWVTGKQIRHVCASVKKARVMQGYSSDDLITCLAEMGDGVAGIFDACYKTNIWRVSFEFHGDDGSCLIHYLPKEWAAAELITRFSKPRRKEIRRVVGRDLLILEEKKGWFAIHFKPFNEYERQMHHFVEAISSDLPVRTPLLDAAETMTVLQAAYQSSKDCRWTQVSPLKGEFSVP